MDFEPLQLLAGPRLAAVKLVIFEVPIIWSLHCHRLAIVIRNQDAIGILFNHLASLLYFKHCDCLSGIRLPCQWLRAYG